MTDTATAPADTAKRTATQVSLELGTPPRFANARVDLEQIAVRDFGTPPSDELVRSVEALGVLEPVILDPNTDDGSFRVIDGRRRVLAAKRNELGDVPALVLESGDIGLLGSVIPLAANDPRDPNPIIELESIEELMRQRSGIALPTIAGELGVKLKTLRQRMKLAVLEYQFRDAWRAGKFGTKVGEAIARCDDEQRRELLRRLEAAGTVTIEDVKQARRIGVETHQRTLAADRKYARAREDLEKIRKALYLDLGEKHEVMQALDDAIDGLKELE